LWVGRDDAVNNCGSNVRQEFGRLHHALELKVGMDRVTAFNAVRVFILDTTTRYSSATSARHGCSCQKVAVAVKMVKGQKGGLLDVYPSALMTALAPVWVRTQGMSAS